MVITIVVEEEEVAAADKSRHRLPSGTFLGGLKSATLRFPVSPASVLVLVVEEEDEDEEVYKEVYLTEPQSFVW
jgi:hypothetical protein